MIFHVNVETLIIHDKYLVFPTWFCIAIISFDYVVMHTFSIFMHSNINETYNHLAVEING